MNVCVIPARGGSKRIPRKNIKQFHGKPIISYSINAALCSGCFDQVIVSTDCDEIGRISKECGALVPFMRPKELADDFTITDDVVRHTIGWFKDNGENIDNICCLYATAPFVRSNDLIDSLKVFNNSNANYLFPITSFAFPIQRAIKVLKGGGVQPFYSEQILTRSQDLEESYHDAGLFYWGKASAYIEKREFYSSKTVPYIMPRYRVQDIDEIEDWKRAELMYSAISTID